MAERLFAERGYEGVSINDVACAAGVCKANVFHHFANKQDLYERVLAQACTGFARSLDAVPLDECRLDERLARLYDWHHAFLRDRPNGTRLILREMMDCSPRLTQGPVFGLLRRNFDRVVALLAESRDEMRADVEVAVLAKLLLSLNLFGFQTEHLDQRLSGTGALPLEPEFRYQWLKVLLQGVQRRAN
ncbi:MAG: helix-turn-helix domain-containing protein [Tahibacter sp.]